MPPPRPALLSGVLARSPAPAERHWHLEPVWLKRLDEAWQRRWDARGAPLRVETSASAVIEGSTPEQVWAFIRPAESAVLLLPEVFRAFTVPGTGPGVGEQQCFVAEVQGKEHISRITAVAYEPPAFAEAVTTTSPGLSSAGAERAVSVN